MADFHKAGLLCINDGRILLCRKTRATSLLILPGGKLEEGETAEDCLRRECREELGNVEIAGLRHLGDYESPAAGHEGKTVRIELFAGDVCGTPVASAEIGELVWFGRQDDWALLAVSLREIIFPDLLRRGLIPESSKVGASG